MHSDLNSKKDRNFVREFHVEHEWEGERSTISLIRKKNISFDKANKFIDLKKYKQYTKKLEAYTKL